MEKILVCIKRVIDYNVKIRISPDESGVITDGVKMSINPFDEIALEEALRIKESGNANEVIIVSIGPDDTQQQLRTGLAMGADRAIHIEHPTSLEPIQVAKLLSKIVEQEQPELILMGKQAGLEILDIDLPAIVTVDLRLNEPRYVKLPDIMKAKKKPLEVLDPVSLNVNLDPSIKVLNVSAPPPRQSGVMLEDASQLVSSLKEKGLLND